MIDIITLYFRYSFVKIIFRSRQENSETSKTIILNEHILFVDPIGTYFKQILIDSKKLFSMKLYGLPILIFLQ